MSRATSSTPSSPISTTTVTPSPAKREQAEELADSLVAQQEATEQSTKDFEEAKAEAEAKLGDLIAEEQARRAAESPAGNRPPQPRPQRPPRRARTTTAAAGTRPAAAAVAASNAGTSSNAGVAAPASSGPAPAVSSRSGIAISAAMGQQGVPYRFAASSPGVAFDCSGLTAYAWAQAGVVPAPPVAASSTPPCRTCRRARPSRVTCCSITARSATWASISAAASSSMHRTRARS